MKIFVALSGGVDSTVAAHILQKEGHDITGVFIRVWQPDFLPCSQDEEEKAAKRVAAHLGIPFRRLDLSEEYKKEVVDHMVSEYRAGRTPNPDVLCNAHIKFGAFLAYAQENGADKIATGHHARVHEDGGVSSLLRGIDTTKDQAYFLWKLSQNELVHTLMPIGELHKSDVRAYAEEHNLPSAYKPDSQGLCFIGHVDMRTFLSHFIETREGSVLDESGSVVGVHDGAELVTIGQRGGFTITDKQMHGDVYYVVAKNIEDNTITVATEPRNTANAQTTFRLTETNWNTTPMEGGPYNCEIRYHGTPIRCTLQNIENDTATVILEEAVLVAQGQSIVLYHGDICIGGSIVT